MNRRRCGPAPATKSLFEEKKEAGKEQCGKLKMNGFSVSHYHTLQNCN